MTATQRRRRALTASGAGRRRVTVLVVGDIVTDILAVHEGPLAVGSDTAARSA